jgi:flagellar biosynthesis chaperone FliJ
VFTTQLLTLRPALSNITNRASQLEALTENSSTRRQTPPAPGNKNSKATKEDNKGEQAITKHEVEQRNNTVKVLQKIVTRLQNTEKSIDKDRDRLRNRWEMDTRLQVQTVTDNLSDLNECFTRVENGVRDALAIINERVLS